MRILLVGDMARPHNGGANRVVVETCRLLHGAGHDVALVHQDDGPTAVDVPTHRLADGGTPESFAAVLDAVRPEVVQIHAVRRPALLAESAARRPTCVFLHDQTWFCASGDRTDRHFEACHHAHGPACLLWNYAQGCGGLSPLGNWRRWRLTGRLQVLRRLPRVRLQVASDFMARGLLENGHSPDRIDRVALFGPVPDPTPAPPPEPGLLLLPSRLVPAKGIQVAIDALALLRDLPWRLVVAGDGWHRGALEMQAGSVGLADRIRFLGEISPGELDGWYRRAAAVLFPVLRPEPFGLVGVEALAHGRPLVGFAGGGADEWMTDQAAFRVLEKTPAALADGIRRVLTEPGLAARLAAGARNTATRFLPEAYLERLLTSFERTVRGG